MSIAIGTMTVRCDICQTVHNISSDEADFDNTLGSERQMGPENGYIWEHTIECVCGNEIELTCEVWEYPQGAFNNENNRAERGTILKEFDYDFHGDPNPDDY